MTAVLCLVLTNAYRTLDANITLQAIRSLKAVPEGCCKYYNRVIHIDVFLKNHMLAINSEKNKTLAVKNAGFSVP